MKEKTLGLSSTSDVHCNLFCNGKSSVYYSLNNIQIDLKTVTM